MDNTIIEAEIVPPKRTQEVLNQEYTQLVAQLGDQVYKILKQFDLIKNAIDKIHAEASVLNADKPKE